MRISARTQYRTFREYEQFLTDESAELLKREAEKHFRGMYDLTFAEFYACSNGDFGEILGNTEQPTVLQVYWCKRFADFAKELAAELKRMTITPTGDEQRASAGLLKVDWGEAILVFLQKYFGLKSFKEAEQITIGELLIAKRAQYNADKFQREIVRIQTQKLKSK